VVRVAPPVFSEVRVAPPVFSVVRVALSLVFCVAF
jgi:hypothetical protein